MKVLQVPTFPDALDRVMELRGSGGTIEIQEVCTYTIPAGAPRYMGPRRKVRIRPVRVEVPPSAPDLGVEPEGFLVVDADNPYANVYVRWEDLEHLKAMIE